MTRVLQHCGLCFKRIAVKFQVPIQKHCEFSIEWTFLTNAIAIIDCKSFEFQRGAIDEIKIAVGLLVVLT